MELDKIQVNIQGVEHDLRQIDSRLYNNEHTQRVIQELGSKYMNEQHEQLHKLFVCFFNWEALAKDAVEQNLIPHSSITFENSRES